MRHPMCALHITGAAAAKFAGSSLHASLLKDEAYIAGRYPEALKNAFINTDADMKSGMSNHSCS